MVNFTPAPSTSDDLARLEQDYQQAREFGPMRLGAYYLFYPVALHMGYAALKDIEWIYGQREEFMMSMCCFRTPMEQSCVMLVLANGKRKKISFRDGGDISPLLAELRQQAPDMRVGNVAAAGQHNCSC